MTFFESVLDSLAVTFGISIILNVPVAALLLLRLSRLCQVLLRNRPEDQALISRLRASRVPRWTAVLGYLSACVFAIGILLLAGQCTFGNSKSLSIG